MENIGDPKKMGKWDKEVLLWDLCNQGRHHKLWEL